MDEFKVYFRASLTVIEDLGLNCTDFCEELG